MAKNKKENAMLLDPNRFKIAQQNSVMPGGPPNQQNNPMNVTSIGRQPASSNGISQHPYGDTGNQYAQMGADVLNPVMVSRSNLPQNMPMGQGKNAGAPFGMQMQPSGNAQEPLEGMRLASNAASKGLIANPFMGVTGSAALVPGAMDPTIPGTSSPLGAMPTIQQVDAGQMVPGSTPQKIQKKGKK